VSLDAAMPRDIPAIMAIERIPQHAACLGARASSQIMTAI